MTTPIDRLRKIRDELAEAESEICYCAGPTCSGCESNTRTLVKLAWDACLKELGPEIERLKTKAERLVTAFKELAQCNCKEYAAGPNMMETVVCFKCEALLEWEVEK